MRAPPRSISFVLAALLSGCAAAAPAPPAPSTPAAAANSAIQSASADVQGAITQLNTTAAGQNIISWAAGGIANAKADVEAFNASLPGGGLTVAKVQGLCGADNSLHTLLQVALPFVPSFGETATSIDNVVYAGIQDACAAATGGTMPTSTQLSTLVTGFTNATTALGIKL